MTEVKCPSCLAEDGESDEYDRETLDEHHLDVHGMGLSDEKLDEIEDTGGVLNGAREDVVEIKREDLDADAADVAERVEGLTEIAAFCILDELTHGEIEEPDDEGDDETTVYHLQESVDEGGTFHVDEGCGYIYGDNEPKEISRTELQDADAEWSACSSCGDDQGDVDETSEDDSAEEDSESSDDSVDDENMEDEGQGEKEGQEEDTHDEDDVDLEEDEWRDVFLAARYSERVDGETLLKLAERASI